MRPWASKVEVSAPTRNGIGPNGVVVPPAPGRTRPVRNAVCRAPMIMPAEMIGGIGVELYTSGHGRKWEVLISG